MTEHVNVLQMTRLAEPYDPRKTPQSRPALIEVKNVLTKSSKRSRTSGRSLRRLFQSTTHTVTATNNSAAEAGWGSEFIVQNVEIGEQSAATASRAGQTQIGLVARADRQLEQFELKISAAQNQINRPNIP